jgi:hypothetical protein
VSVIPAQPNTAAKNLIITPLRGMGSAKVDLVRNGASVVVTVTFVAGLNYSAWNCYAAATAADAGKTIPITPVITTDGSGRRVVTLTFVPATFYGISGLDFDSRYVAYPRSFRIEAWHERELGGKVYADIFLGGTVSLTTAQPNYLHSVTQA